MLMTPRDWALLILLSILWGGAFFFAGVAVKEVPPLTLVFSRVALASLVLFAFLRIRGESLPGGWKVMFTFGVMGLMNNLIPFTLLFWAQTSIPSGLASILNATTPLFSMIVAHFLLTDERMAANKVMGVILGFIGVIILFGGDVLSGTDPDQTIKTLAILACLGAAFSYGIAGVYGRRFRAMDISPSVSAFGQLTATSVMMIPLVLVMDRPWSLPLPGPEALASILALAVASTAVAYLIFFHLLAKVGAVNVTLVTLLIPLSAILLGASFLAEVLEARHYVGMALIFTALIAVDGRLIRIFSSRSAA